MTGEKLENWEKCREVGNLAKSCLASFALGAAIRILDEMKFPTLGETKFLTRVTKNAHSGGALHSYVTLCHTRGGCPARFWGAFLATFARHWYTGKRFLDEISERILSTQQRRYRKRNAQLCHARG